MANLIKTLFSVVICTLLIAGCSTPGPSNTPAKPILSDADNVVDPIPLTSDAFSDIPFVSGDIIDIENSLVLNPGDNWIGRLMLKSNLVSDHAFEYYSTKMADYGWNTLTSIQSDNSTLMFEKGARVATVVINRIGRRGSSINVTVSLRQVPSY
jgi:hypothetical protein